jgi:glutamate dehydrogenase
MITNRVVDHAGCAFLHLLSRQTGATIIEGVSAYLVFDQVLNGDAMRKQIMAADNKMPTRRQYDLLLDLEKTLAGLCSQVIEQRLPMHLDKECVRNYRESLATFRLHLQDLLPPMEWQVCKDAAAILVKDGFPLEMALEVASFRYLVGFLPAVHIAESTGAELLTVTTAMGDMRLQLKISQVMESLNEYTPHDRWDKMALANLRSAFIKQAVKLTEMIVAEGRGASSFFAAKRQRIDYYLNLVDTMRSSPPTSISPYVVLLKALEAVEG